MSRRVRAAHLKHSSFPTAPQYRCRRVSATGAARRVLIVSNRLPISVTRERQGLKIAASAGGLATGLAGVHGGAESLWIGWPGHSEQLSAAESAFLARTYRDRQVRAVDLTADEVDRYYERFCNGVLWPLFHYLIGQLPLDVEGFDLYEAINRRFADAVVAEHRPGDLIWVHDYQLMLVPRLVRDRIPDAAIGYFHHIPFPSSDVFRTLPFRDQLLHGILGADVIGFHVPAYVRNFASAALLRLGVPTDVDRMRWDNRTIRIGVFPMGVDAASFDRAARSPELLAEVGTLRQPEDMKILVGIDRLDYTKGIPRRLLAFERLLRDHPELRGKVRLIQVAVPSRQNVDAYQDYRAQVDGIIGRIHGAFATPTWVPINYIFRNLPPREVVALYRAADAMLVTPLRDGMNLVAKEFVASRSDDDGVLVLSEFAGADSELAEAVHVNPFDTAAMAEAFHRAVAMPRDERRTRMRALRRRVMRFDVQRWARLFLDALARTSADRPEPVQMSSPEELEQLRARMRRSKSLVLLLDYDGSLVPFAAVPDLAAPDADLLALLRALAARPGTEVHLVSGRKRDDVERWFGDLPIHLHAEHGLWNRLPGRTGEAIVVDTSWKERVLPILLEYADRTPGALVEEKPAGLAWHFRMADPQYGPGQANELRKHLTELVSNTPVEILGGHEVIELRPHGISKATVVAPIAARLPEALMVAVGDDATDEDMFAALPPSGLSVRVGGGDSRAGLRVATVDDLRALLGSLIGNGD
jgi:trehalose 6-phosphate synthase/phosphatase